MVMESAESVESLTATDRAAADDRRQRCLDWCLQRLERDERDLVLNYFQDERSARIRRRAMLARQLHLTSNALRLRIWRLTVSLRACGVACVETGAAADRREWGTSHHERQ
jgi:hypothetical protein